MPWKGIKDPYRIWLSEIILQQTRVDQGMPYYERFITEFPTVHDLANAPEEAVLKCWQGLGYYTRARNLHAAANLVSGEMGGQFPDTLEGLKTLPGVGDYTAAAIASFAFDKPHAVVDGNVIRVLSRYFGMEESAATSAGKKQFTQLANEVMDKQNPAVYNQAIMDFGALQCTPASPNCLQCPLNDSCFARAKNKVAELPVKKAKVKRRDRYFLYLVLQTESGNCFIRQRTQKDIWQNLYEFPLIEKSRPGDLPLSNPETLGQMLFGEQGKSLKTTAISKSYKHILSHQTVHAIFVKIDLPKENQAQISGHILLQNCLEAAPMELKKIYPLPRLIMRFWEENALSLSLL